MIRALVILLGLVGCGDSPVPPEAPTPIPTLVATATPAPQNPVCNEELSAHDGPGGFLWKPRSDHRGTLVVLLPSRFVQPFDRVTVQRRSGNYERLTFTGFANGNRQHWRGSLPGGKYLPGSLLVAENGANVCAWRLGRTGRRND